MGLLTNVLPGEAKESHSITKSAIAPGNLEVENLSMNLEDINRDVESSLNKLANIFNKQDIEERQQLTKLFNKYSNEAIHHIAEMNDWEDGSNEKVALHGLVGLFSNELINSNKANGFAVGALSEKLAPEIERLSKGDPAKAQWLGFILGYTADKILGGNGQQGGSISQYAIKWNQLDENAYDKAYLIFDRYPDAAHIAILFSDGFKGAVVEYDSLKYSYKDIVPNGIIKNPVQGIVRQEILDNPKAIEAYMGKRKRERVLLRRYSKDDIKRHIRYVNNIMNNSKMAKGIDKGTTFYKYLQYINNSSYGRVEFYPSDGWQDYILTRRNCVIFASTPVMAERYNFDRLEVFIPSSLYKIIKIDNIMEKINEQKNHLPKDKG